MKDFEFHRPATIKDAVGLVKGREGAKFLAGGQSLLPVLKLELAEPSDLVSLAKLNELRDIRVDGGNLLIGALVTHDEVSRSPEVKRTIPALAALAGAIGVPPAVINAVIDALIPLGVTDISMPATPEKIWRAIQAAQAAKKGA